MKLLFRAGFTKYRSENMKIFDLIPSDQYKDYVDRADLIITHGGAGSIIQSIRLGKKVIAVPRLQKYSEHVNDHQLEIVKAFKNKGYIIGINDVSELKEALLNVDSFKPIEFKGNTDKMINIISEFIEKN